MVEIFFISYYQPSSVWQSQVSRSVQMELLIFRNEEWTSHTLALWVTSSYKDPAFDRLKGAKVNSLASLLLSTFLRHLLHETLCYCIT